MAGREASTAEEQQRETATDAEVGLSVILEVWPARLRSRIVPAGPPPAAAAPRHAVRPDSGSAAAQGAVAAVAAVRHPRRSRNYSWAELMRRVGWIDVLECAACHGRMRILAAIHSPEAIRAILDCLGRPSREPLAAAAAERKKALVHEEWVFPDPDGE